LEPNYGNLGNNLCVVGRYGETLEVAYENLEGKNFEIGFLSFVV